MSVSLNSVLKQLGDDAQLVGGRIVVYRDGKHTDVGGLSMSDDVFSLTSAGKDLLAGKVEAPVVEAVVEVPAVETAVEAVVETKKPNKKTGLAPVEDAASDLNLEDLA